MAGSACPAVGIPCSLATAFIENDRAQTSVNDFRLMCILLIGLYEDGGDERDRYNTSASGFFRTDRSACELPGRTSRCLSQIWRRCPEAECKRADIGARYRPRRGYRWSGSCDRRCPVARRFTSTQDTPVDGDLDHLAFRCQVLLQIAMPVDFSGLRRFTAHSAVIDQS
jgi:hypothetical protein